MTRPTRTTILLLLGLAAFAPPRAAHAAEKRPLSAATAQQRLGRAQRDIRGLGNMSPLRQAWASWLFARRIGQLSTELKGASAAAPMDSQLAVLSDSTRGAATSAKQAGLGQGLTGLARQLLTAASVGLSKKARAAHGKKQTATGMMLTAIELGSAKLEDPGYMRIEKLLLRQRAGDPTAGTALEIEGALADEAGRLASPAKEYATHHLYAPPLPPALFRP
ncbi:MAG: hypothetical protein IT371_21750 [Deltaproteobacteria bacterium]|nr:hypothetical protein [Deltaproteobacteria bacterium]